MAAPPQQDQQGHALAVGVASALAAGGATLASLGPTAAGLKAEQEAGQQLGQLSAKAVGELTERILKLMLRFARERAAASAPSVQDSLARSFPERDRSELDDLAREELRRERVFRERMRDRLLRDLPKVLSIADADARRAALQGLLDRERRYIGLREEAIHDRATARAEMLAVKEASPLGAYWVLSPYVMNHTPDCVALAGKFWPWSVIEAVGPPPRHHGCACQLLTLDEAAERGWIDQEQAHGVDEKDALRRAKELLKDAETITEALSQEEWEAWLGELAEADNVAALEEAGVYTVDGAYMILDERGKDVARVRFDPPEVVSDDSEVAAWATAGCPRQKGVVKDWVASEPETLVKPTDPMWPLAVLTEMERRGWRFAGAARIEEALRRLPELHRPSAPGHLPLRYAKGFEHGGEFAPKLGGDPGARLKGAAKRALMRALAPELPRSPAELRVRGDGRETPIEGRKVFVPVARRFERVINGHRYTSPALSPHVYRDGEPYEPTGQKSPGVAAVAEPFQLDALKAALSKAATDKPKAKVAKPALTTTPTTAAAAAAAKAVGVDLQKAWARGDASPANSGRAEFRAQATAAILKSDTAVPDAALLLVGPDGAREQRIKALVSGPDSDRAFKEYASTPIGDLEVLGGIKVRDTPLSGQAACYMQSREVEMGSSSVTGDFRHELGHAIRSAMGGDGGPGKKNEMTSYISALHDKAMAKAKAAQAKGLKPAEFHGEAAQDWFAENYGVIDMRSLDNWEEDFAEHYRAYQKAVYQTLNPDKPGGDAGRLARYRELFPEWAAMWDAWYTGQLAGAESPLPPELTPQPEKTTVVPPAATPPELPPSFLDALEASPKPKKGGAEQAPSPKPPGWTPPPKEAYDADSSGTKVADLGYDGGKATAKPAPELSLKPGDYIEGNPDSSTQGTRYIIVADASNPVSGLGYVKLTDPDGKTKYLGKPQSFHFEPPTAKFKKLDGHFDLPTGPKGQKSPGFSDWESPGAKMVEDAGDRLKVRVPRAALGAILDGLADERDPFGGEAGKFEDRLQKLWNDNPDAQAFRLSFRKGDKAARNDLAAAIDAARRIQDQHANDLPDEDFWAAHDSELPGSEGLIHALRQLDTGQKSTGYDASEPTAEAIHAAGLPPINGVRSVLETKLPGGWETRIASGYPHASIPTPNETELGHGTPAVWVNGDIYKDGKHVGAFERSVAVVDGELHVYNGNLFLDDGARGKGFASAFRTHTDAGWQRLGAKWEHTDASDEGSGVWAHMGFDFDVQAYRDEAERYGDEEEMGWTDAEWRDHLLHRVKAEAGIADGSKLDKPSIGEIAATKEGREALFGVEWKGIRRIAAAEKSPGFSWTDQKVETLDKHTRRVTFGDGVAVEVSRAGPGAWWAGSSGRHAKTIRDAAIVERRYGATGQKSPGFEWTTKPGVTTATVYATAGTRGEYVVSRVGKVWRVDLDGQSLGTVPSLARGKEMAVRVDANDQGNVPELAATFGLSDGATYAELWNGRPDGMSVDDYLARRDALMKAWEALPDKGVRDQTVKMAVSAAISRGAQERMKAGQPVAATTDPVSEILADYHIPDSLKARETLDSMLAAHGEAGVRARLSQVHGTPDEIAAGNPKRMVIANRARSHPISRETKAEAKARLDATGQKRGDLAVAAPALTDARVARVEQLRTDRRSPLEERIRDAVVTRDPELPPVAKGMDGRTADDALRNSGFAETDVTPAGGGGHHSTYRSPDGVSELRVTYGTDGKIRDVKWEPRDQKVVRPMTRPPSTWGEFTEDIHAFAQQLAATAGRGAMLGDIEIDPDPSSDHAAEHQWDGTLVLGADFAPSVMAAAVARKRNRGADLGAPEARMLWSTYQAAAHESLHASNSFDRRLYRDPRNVKLNEALVEELSHLEAVDWLERTGQTDVLRWRADNPLDERSLGTYKPEREGLEELLNLAKVAPEERPDYMRRLYHQGPPDDRFDRVAADVASAQGISHADALEQVHGVLDGVDGSRPAHDFVPQTLPDHSPTADADYGPTLAGRPVRPGDKIGYTERTLVDGEWQADAHDGVVERVTERSNGKWTMDVRRDDGTLDRAIVVSQVAAHEPLGERLGWVSGAGAPGAATSGGDIRPGMLVRWDGRADGGYSTGRVERIIRDRNPHDPTGEGWAVEVVAGEDSLSPGSRVILTPERVGGEIAPAGHAANLRDSQNLSLTRPAAPTLEDAAELAPFFDMPAGTFVVPTGRLVPAKMDSPARVDRARAHMEGAEAGRLPKRGPLSVHPSTDGRFVILDGAATWAAARGMGLRNLPAQLDAVSEIDKHLRVAKRQAATSDAHAGVVEGLTRARAIIAAGGSPDDIARAAFRLPEGDMEAGDFDHGVQVGFRSAFIAATESPLARQAMERLGVPAASGQATPGFRRPKGGWGLGFRPKGEAGQDEGADGGFSGKVFDWLSQSFDGGADGWTAKSPWVPKPPKPVTDDSGRITVKEMAGGSNGARYGYDDAGTKWLVKSYRGDEDRVATELLANSVYRQLGIAVPDAGTLSFDGKAALAYPLVEGVPGGGTLRVKSESSGLAQGFMADALLGNWDVVGLEHDNLLWPEGTTPESWSADLEPVRLDQGGSLQFRAMGGLKEFGPVPSEVWTMAGPRGQAFGTMELTPELKREQAARVAEVLTPKVIDGLVAAAPFKDEKMRKEVRVALKARVKWMGRYAAGQEAEPTPAKGPRAAKVLAAGQRGLELFPEQEVALSAWRAGWDAVVNDHLRTGAPKDAAAKEVRFLTRELDSLLSHVRTEGQIEAYAALSARVRPDEGWSGLVGRTLDERGFLGLSSKRAAAEDEGDALLRVLVPDGSRVLSLDAIDGIGSGEPQFLAARRSRLRVVRVTEGKTRTVVDVVMMP